MPLFQTHRPKEWAQFAGNSKAIKQVRAVIGRASFDGGAMWIAGPTGCGKTTLAKLVAAQIADDFHVEEIDGKKCDMGAVDEIEKSIRIMPMVGEWKVYIVNESHNITRAAVQMFLTLLDEVPAKRLFIFTTTETRDDLFGEFTAPLLSRCLRVNLDNSDRESMALRAKAVAESEGLGGASLDHYRNVVDRNNGNMRAVMYAIENGDCLEDEILVAKPKKLSALEEMKQRYKIA